ncbi:MAG: hypothetical protein AAF514_01255 [Verrucomicrobiota bacterium]
MKKNDNHEDLIDHCVDLYDEGKYAMIHRKKGDAQKAFDYAYRYLDLRKKSIPSTWSKKEAIREIRAYEKRWKEKRDER